MKIQLLEDNTVAAQYDNILGRENVNSNHAEKALTEETRLLAEAFPYKGVYLSTDDADLPITFNGLFCVMKTDDGVIILDPLAELPTDDVRLSTFAEIVFNDNVRAAFIAQLPLAHAMVDEQQTVRVKEGTPNAFEQTLAIPDGEQVINMVDGVPVSTTIYEVAIWLLAVVNEDGTPHMEFVKSFDSDGEPIMEHYHKLTDTRYPL